MHIYIHIGIYIHICSMMHKGFRLRAAQGRASIAREREPTSTASATARLRAAGASSPTGGCSSSPTARLRAAVRLAYGRLQLAYRQPDTARLRAAAVHLESAPTGGNTLLLAYGRLAYGRQHGCSPTGGNGIFAGSAICSQPDGQHMCESYFSTFGVYITTISFRTSPTLHIM